MSRSTDFHFRMSPRLRLQLEKAVNLITVKGDRRRKTDRPSMSDLVVSFIEAGLYRLSFGMSIVDSPSMMSKSAIQKIDAKNRYVAPLLGADIYQDVLFSPRPLTLDESSVLDQDARHVVVGAELVFRGNAFTQKEDLDQRFGQTCRVAHVARKQAAVMFGRGRKPVPVHVYDLIPEAGHVPTFGKVVSVLPRPDAESVLARERRSNEVIRGLLKSLRSMSNEAEDGESVYPDEVSESISDANNHLAESVV